MHIEDPEKIIVDTVIKCGTATIQMLQIALVLHDPVVKLPTYQATLRLVQKLVAEGELTLSKAANLAAQRKRASHSSLLLEKQKIEANTELKPAKKAAKLKDIEARIAKAKTQILPPPTAGKLVNSPTIIRAGEKARLRIFERVPEDQRRVKNDRQKPKGKEPKRVRAGVRAAPFSKHQAHHRAIANFHLLLTCRELGIDFFKYAITEFEIAAGRAYLNGEIVRAEFLLQTGTEGQNRKKPDGFLSPDSGESWSAIEVEPSWKNTSRRHKIATLDRTIAVTDIAHIASITLGPQNYLPVTHLVVVHGHPGSVGQMMASLAAVPRRDDLHTRGEPPAWPTHHLVKVDKQRLGLAGWYVPSWVDQPDDYNEPAAGVPRHLAWEIARLWPKRRRSADRVIIPAVPVPTPPPAEPQAPASSAADAI